MLNQHIVRNRLRGVLVTALSFTGIVALSGSGCSNDNGEAESTFGKDETEGSKTTTSGDDSTDESADTSTTSDSDNSTDDDTSDTSGSSDPTDSSTDPSDSGTTTDEKPHLQFLVVEPANSIIELDLAADSSIDFSAIGHYSDGKKVDLSGMVNWTLTVPEMGDFDESELTLAPHDELFVQTTRVTAEIDGVSGRAQVTVAAYEQDGENPDFLFILPYEDENGEKDAPLSFKTDVQSLDVFFSVDTTGSMGEEIAQLQSSLKNTIIPDVQDEVPDTQFGVGSVQDFPVLPYGSPTGTGINPVPDQPFLVLQTITDVISDVQDGVSALRRGSGGDYPESILEGLYQIATGEGLSGPGPTKVEENHDGVGGVAFRKGSMPIVVSITDASSHAPGETSDTCGRDYTGAVGGVAHTRQETEDSLNAICARVITVASEGGTQGECAPSVDGILLAKATEARVSPAVWDLDRPAACAAGKCCTGKNDVGVDPDDDGLCPLVFGVDKNGNGLGDSVVSGIKALAFFAPFDVLVETSGENTSVDGAALPAGKTTLDFIQAIEAHSFGELPIPGLPDPKLAGDHFEGVTPGTEITFKIRAFNDFIRETSNAQVFRAGVGVTADQCEGLKLDDRQVIFVVPPKPLVAG